MCRAHEMKMKLKMEVLQRKETSKIQKIPMGLATCRCRGVPDKINLSL